MILAHSNVISRIDLKCPKDLFKKNKSGKEQKCGPK
jgi:hypothetical protein